MTETHAKSQTQTSWRDESDEGIRIDTDSGQNAGRAGEGVWPVGLELHRENCSEGNYGNDPLGGILDQLIEDAQKQLVKSQECIVWYQSEAKEVRDKLENLRKLRELRQKELQQVPTTEELQERS
ncbi:MULTISPECIES: hypothetical protein [unclassified Microcoleus]|uniref:hypothetical protein n=1 Tax=unclassified Microcoleus TaxID=2642155 RepID=UPI002FD7146B